jgi:hypothetical protein
MRASRRQFLRGLAGFTLALPVLPSLLPREARASGTVPRRFIAFGTEHGGVWQDHLYPNDATLTEERSYGGHTIRRGDLTHVVQDGRTVVSPVLSAPEGLLTAGLLERMNVLRGLDYPFYLGHHRGGHLGDVAENDGNGGDGRAVQSRPRPTIDQVLAWSDRFYPDTSTILERSLVLGGRNMSTGYANPAEGRGPLQQLPAEFDSRALFDRIFRQDAPSTREPVVDLVIDDYRRLRESDRRLGAADRRRLDEHMERLYELERKLWVSVSCGDLAPPGSSRELRRESGYRQDPERQVRAWQLMNDVVVAAFVCDTCRVVSARANDTFDDYAGDWHQEIAHQANNQTWGNPPSLDGPHPHSFLARGHRTFFEGVLVDLAAKLNAVEMDDGSTLLDACLVQWTHESGPSTHNPLEMPVITFGRAGGGLSTGHYADYRNLSEPAMRPHENRLITAHTGLIYNQWLGTVLQIMGLPRESFEREGFGGYGVIHLSTAGWYAGHDRYGSDVLGVMGDRMPFVAG